MNTVAYSRFAKHAQPNDMLSNVLLVTSRTFYRHVHVSQAAKRLEMHKITQINKYRNVASDVNTVYHKLDTIVKPP